MTGKRRNLTFIFFKGKNFGTMNADISGSSEDDDEDDDDEDEEDDEEDDDGSLLLKL